jgi:L-lactate dehydrogenase (cytochrome)
MASVDPSRVVNIADLRLSAKRRLPRFVFDYGDGGADAEQTLRENCRVFDDVTLRPRCAVAFPDIDLKTTVLGTTFNLPFLLAPIGSTRLFYPKGEIVAAREAAKVGTGYILSTLAGTRVDEVRTATNATVWYQLYIIGGRDVAMDSILRAKQAGCTALVVTIDTAVAGLRERDVRNGVKELVSLNPFKMLPYAAQFATKPGWVADFFLDGGLMKFPNVDIPGKGPMPYADVGAALAASTVTWSDLKWIREVWDGPIIIKGLLTGDDARRAADVGAAAVVVSNHGGRQLDSVSSTLRALPEVVKAVGTHTEVLFDGGIRRGSDIVKAMCLGARGVLIGRAYVYGLGAAGGPGVARAIDILRTDLIRTMRLLGCASLKELDSSYVDATRL